MVMASQMIPAEDAMTLFKALIEIVSRYVPDPKDRQAITEDFTALIDARNTWGTR